VFGEGPGLAIQNSEPTTTVLNQIIPQDNRENAGADALAGSRSRKAPPLTSTYPGRNILSKDVEIRGKLRFSDELVVDGRIEGEIDSEGDLTVGENAVIVGDVRTRSVVVHGRIEGNISVTGRCELKRNAALHGDVVAGKLAIEEGATFMGTSTVGLPKGAEPPAPEPPPEAQADQSADPAADPAAE
jgi:cytoskeletal protein CcmA (bactofilin family)